MVRIAVMMSVRVTMLIATCVVAPLHAAAQTAARVDVEANRLVVAVDDPRPVARVLDELEKLCACAITYEDVRLSSDASLQEITLPQGKGARTRVPKGGHLELSYHADSVRVRDNIRSAVAALLEQYRRLNYPGTFRLLPRGTAIDVLPASDESNRAPTRGSLSILDVPIAFETAELSFEQAIRRIADAVTAATGYQVMPGMMPRVSFGAKLRPEIAGQMRPARQVLGDVLATVDATLSWRLFYDPTIRAYVLNVHVVPQ